MFTYFPQSTPDWIPHFADCPQHEDQPASDADCECAEIDELERIDALA